MISCAINLPGEYRCPTPHIPIRAWSRLISSDATIVPEILRTNLQRRRRMKEQRLGKSAAEFQSFAVVGVIFILLFGMFASLDCSNYIHPH